MRSRTALLVGGGWLLLFAILSYAAVLTKSATFDEPVQATAGWLRLHYGDFRLDFEDPPLWQEWAALPNGADAARPDFESNDWKQIATQPQYELTFSERMLFQTPGFDGAQFLNRSRFMMLLIALALGGLIGWWAWQLGGPAAAVVGLGLFALDPNLLAHGPLVKNDVAMSAGLLGVAFAVWRLGQRFTWLSAGALVLLVAVLANVKFSCVLLVPIVGILLALRVLIGPGWLVLGRTLTTPLHRVLAALLLLVGAGTGAFVFIWAAYRFRFTAMPEPDSHLNHAWVMERVRFLLTASNAGGLQHWTQAAQDAWQPNLPVKALQWLLDNHLLPEAWIEGLLFTYAYSQIRTAFLLNATSEMGWWYYFPFAMLVKTPVATLLALTGATGLGAWLLTRTRRSFDTWWSVACVVVPAGVYLASAMMARVDIGLRYVLPVYGFLYVAAGVVAAAALRRWQRPATLVLISLGAGLAAETLAASPHFLSFFNVAAGGSTNGINLLGDSNIDWGQDLPLLAAWQKEHPGQHLYLSYFGTVDPKFYGIRYRPLPGSYQFGTTADRIRMHLPAVFAISASHLQGVTVGPVIGDMYQKLRSRKPLAVLGGSLYLYDVPDEPTFQELVPRAPDAAN